jgi:uncharacterized protein (TIRG00374 family)
MTTPEPHVDAKQVRQTISKGLRTGGLWILGVLVFLLLLSHNLTQERWTFSMEKLDWPMLLGGWCCMLATMWVLGLRWRVLLRNTSVSRSFFGATLSAGLLINYALPGPMGEFMGGWLLKREDNTPIVEGLTASTLARLMGLFTAAIGSVGLWWFIEIDIPEVEIMMQILLLGIGCGAISLVVLSVQSDKIAKRFEHKETHHPLRLVSTALMQLRELSVKQVLWALLHSTVGHSMAFVGVWLSLLALGGSPSPIDIAFVYLVGTCCGTVAFLFPGSQFTWDAIFTGLLMSSAGYLSGDAILAVGILRIEQIAMMLFGAIPLLWILWRQELRFESGKS